MVLYASHPIFGNPRLNLARLWRARCRGWFRRRGGRGRRGRGVELLIEQLLMQVDRLREEQLQLEAKERAGSLR